MTNYEKGRDGEYYIRERMHEWGYFCERFASSKPFDLIIAIADDAYVAEVKRQELSDEQAQRLWDWMEMELCHEPVLQPVLFYKQNGRWMYLDRAGGGLLAEWRNALQ